jgi:DnaJ-class molecular chaperone
MKTHSKDYYQILGIPADVSEEVIKKAYRKLALTHHPDRNPDDPKSEDRFKEITEAYGVLMDPLKRKEYDRFRASPFTGAHGGPQFRYSQQEIFENMFRQGFGRDIFNDLNTDFKQSGFRTGPDFFGAVFFGTAGGLAKFMRMIPGPIGKIGTGLWLLSTVGSSLYALKKKKQAAQGDPKSQTRKKPVPSVTHSIKKLFVKPAKGSSGKDDPNLYYSISITPVEALSGAKKQISYQIGGDSEKLQVSIPPGISSGKKLRLREKGSVVDKLRGDLILTVQVKS